MKALVRSFRMISAVRVPAPPQKRFLIAYLALPVVLLSVACGARAAESLTTVRIGEQAPCDISGATTYTPGNPKQPTRSAESTIRFDLARIPADTRVTKATLRIWVVPAGAFSINRWNEEGFDGFKCFQIGADDKPLGVSYPFASAHYALHEWNVTPAVTAWLARPEANQGLRLNCPLAGNADEPAWRRPYLQITYAAPNPGRPNPPTDMHAFYRAGQVFVTWKQIPYDGAFFDGAYRVYAAAEPITAENLDAAALLGEAHANSQLNYRRSSYIWDGQGSYCPFLVGSPYLRDRLPKDEKGAPVGDFPALQRTFQERYNFVIDDTWPEKTAGGKWMMDGTALPDGRHILEGPQLSDDTGLFVWTVDKPGKKHFAVTSVIEGNENRQDIRAGNSAGPIEVKIEPIKPVLQFVLHTAGRTRPEQYRQYAYWGGPSTGTHNTEGTPFMLQINAPRRFLWNNLRADNVSQYAGAGWDLNGDLGYAPPTPNTPFPSIRVSLNPDFGHWVPAWKFYYGSRKAPASPGETETKFIDEKLPIADGTHANVYGYLDRLNTGADPRRATAMPYVENRIVLEHEMFFALFPAADRAVTRAASQRPLMTLAMHRGDKFAVVSSAMDTPWTSKRAAGMWVFAGRKEWNIKTPEGFSVWDWNDPVWFSKQFPNREWAWITTCQSPNYDRGDDLYNWQDMGYPQFYKALEAQKRAGWWWWGNIGDAPDGGGGGGPLNEAVPAFANATCSQQPLPHWPDERKGTLTGYIEWHTAGMPFVSGKQVRQPPVSLGVVDEETRFEMAFRIRARGLALNGSGAIPPCAVDFGMTDITPRRLQKFKAEKGKKYAWKNVQVETGRVLQSGVTEPDENGLLTVPQFFVDRNLYGNKLILVPGDKPDPPDTASKVVLAMNSKHAPSEARELEYAEYADNCRAPEMVKKVRPGRVFAIGSLTGGSASGDYYSMWGAGFSDAFEFPEAGRYRVDVRFRAAFKHAGAWPTLNLSAALPERQDVMLDSDQPKVYSWWIDMDAPGRRNVDFSLVNRTFNSPAPHDVMVDGKRMTRGFSVDNLTFVPLGKRPDKVTETLRVYIVTRSIQTGVNLPVQVRAEVQDAWGEALDKKPAWTVSEGASISADGVFSAPKEGAYTVTATADGKSDAVPVTVAGGAWVENFDDMNEDGWTTVSLDSSGKEEGGWNAKSIHQYGRVYRDFRASGPSAVVWDGGAVWNDYTAQADRLLPTGSGARTGPHSGLVFRYADKDNFYRFEQDLPGKAFRLIKRFKGLETELAGVEKNVPIIALEGEAVKAYPTFKYYPKDSKYFDALKTFAYDRFKVEAKGDSIACSFNGVEVLTATDGDLKGGTVGLYCDGGAVFDNVEVKMLK